MADQNIGMIPPDPISPPPKSDLFLGPHGLRAGWRLLVYVVLVIGGTAAIMVLMEKLFHPQRGLVTAWSLLWQELFGFAVVFGVAFVMSRIEGRPLGAYGLPGREAFGAKFWMGFLFGLLEISVLIWLIRVFGGYSFGPIALPANEILKMGLLYLGGFIFVGFFEEFLFRGYTLYTLADGIGFWPAAFVLSLLFGGAHLMNPGEGWVGAASVVLIALFFCFSLRRTGSLWYAVGLHASFDWGETFLYSVPNSGAVMPGHLSNAVLQAGPKWLTGGTVGPEGSVFCFLTILLQFLVVLWLFPAPKTEAGVRAVAVQT
ncbi:MAG TPA: type II CAAX endopeptidase family protein [Candidatus Sulfotelmatobacter sp.]|nr:type II CAAX endopeptidase family protein [Candidatus Sulfotelmatobacter sp.]